MQKLNLFIYLFIYFLCLIKRGKRIHDFPPFFQLGKDNSEMEGKFQSLSLNNNEKKADTPIEEVMIEAL